MNAQTLSHFPMPWLTCVALVIFFTVFAATVAWVFKKSNQAIYERMATLPLQEKDSL